MNIQRFASISFGLTMTLFSTGCELMELAEFATSDRPNATQAQAVGNVLGHFGAVANVVDNPSVASDSDVADMFKTEPYFKLLDPEGKATALVLAGGRAAPVFGPDCVVTEGSDASWDCEIDFFGQTCSVNGSGSKLGEGMYTGMAELNGDQGVCAAGISVDAAFTLVMSGDNPSGSGTLTINQGGEGAFGFVAELDNLGFCENGLPNSGRMTVTGTGTAANLPFNPITIKFTGGACGAAIIE